MADQTRILGIGVDLVETARITASIERFGDRFLQRVFTEAEIRHCKAMKHSPRHFGARFAAKEAVSKAFGTGLGEILGWTEIEVIRQESGAPSIRLHGNARAHAEKLKVADIFISLSHSENYSVANAIVTVQN
jgi:holo-[acyl-carrier protein] synthase